MNINFSENLRKAIKLRGVTQAWLADKSNQNEATISRYANGVNKSPQIDILVEIAKALNISADVMLTSFGKFSKTTLQQRKKEPYLHQSKETSKQVKGHPVPGKF